MRRRHMRQLLMIVHYLKKNLIAFNHAQFATRALLDRFGSLFEIAHLGIQHRVARLRLLIGLFLRLDLAVEIPYL